MNSTEKTSERNPTRFASRVRFLFSICALVLFSFACVKSVSFHRVGLYWACSELSARNSGQPQGILASRLSRNALETWSRYHRDILVRRGALIHRTYRFDAIPVPSPEAQFLEAQFLKLEAGRAESAFSTSGRSWQGDVYAVNVWFSPDAVSFWDEWYKTHNNQPFVTSLLNAQKR